MSALSAALTQLSGKFLPIVDAGGVELCICMAGLENWDEIAASTEDWC
jgi:hypothetical protein